MANAQSAVDDKTFFAGAHLGITIDQCAAYYRELGHVGVLEHSGAPRGQRSFDFRTGSNPLLTDDAQWRQRRVYVYFRTSDGKIVSLEYWKSGADNETFSKEEIRYLKDLNKGQGSLVTEIAEEGTVFTVTTAEQEKIEQAQ